MLREEGRRLCGRPSSLMAPWRTAFQVACHRGSQISCNYFIGLTMRDRSGRRLAAFRRCPFPALRAYGLCNGRVMENRGGAGEAAAATLPPEQGRGELGHGARGIAAVQHDDVGW